MNKELVQFIQKLSAEDTKSLSQKALKACEEVGELAKVVLPFENAFACQHRFVDRKAILEEVADVILTVQSIAYSLGFSEDELDEMIKDKSMYWAELQNRDKAAKFPVPFEIHVTVKCAEVERFKEACKELNIKPLLLDLQNKVGENILNDLMTSSIHVGDNSSVYKELQRISNGLKSLNFDVVREKIETVPWHPAAPSKKHINPEMPTDCYFESHLAIITDEASLPILRDIVTVCGCHLSKNIFKKIDDQHFKIMATYRKYDMLLEDFQANVNRIKQTIEEHNFAIDRVIVEFSVYDSRVSHDAAWLKT